MLNDEKINLLKKVSENNNSNNNNKDITSLINSLQKENDILKNKNIILKQEIKKIPSLIEAEMKKFKENFKNNNNIKKIVIQQNNNNNNKNKFVNLNLEKKIELNLISNNKNNNKINNINNNKQYENVEEDELQNLQEMLIIKDKKNKVICKNLSIIEQYLNQIGFFEKNQNNKVQKLIKQSLNL
jgi:hypothetical protein